MGHEVQPYHERLQVMGIKKVIMVNTKLFSQLLWYWLRQTDSPLEIFSKPTDFELVWA